MSLRQENPDYPHVGACARGLRGLWPTAVIGLSSPEPVIHVTVLRHARTRYSQTQTDVDTADMLTELIQLARYCAQRKRLGNERPPWCDEATWREL